MAKRKQRDTRRAQQRARNQMWLIGGALAAVLLVAILFGANQTVASRPPTTAIASSGKVWGNPKAPVTINLYGDFQCPVCAQADRILN